jgi:hypothetical protein
MREFPQGGSFYRTKAGNFRITIAYKFRINEHGDFSKLHRRWSAYSITVFRLTSQ